MYIDHKELVTLCYLKPCAPIKILVYMVKDQLTVCGLHLRYPWFFPFFCHNKSNKDIYVLVSRCFCLFVCWLVGFYNCIVEYLSSQLLVVHNESLHIPCVVVEISLFQSGAYRATWKGGR